MREGVSSYFFVRPRWILIFAAYQKKQFQKAANEGGFEVTDEQKLMLYALYKIVTVSQKPIVQRPLENSIDAIKWDAWNEFDKEFDCESALILYPRFVVRLMRSKLN